MAIIGFVEPKLRQAAIGRTISRSRVWNSWQIDHGGSQLILLARGWIEEAATTDELRYMHDMLERHIATLQQLSRRALDRTEEL